MPREQQEIVEPAPARFAEQRLEERRAADVEKAWAWPSSSRRAGCPGRRRDRALFTQTRPQYRRVVLHGSRRRRPAFRSVECQLDRAGAAPGFVNSAEQMVSILVAPQDRDPRIRPVWLCASTPRELDGNTQL
jgi:hypothetical protein